MAELQGLGAALSEAEKTGVEIVAVSPDPNARSHEMAQRLHLGYRFVADQDLAVTRRYGLVHARGGAHGEDVPTPTTVVLDQNGPYLRVLAALTSERAGTLQHVETLLRGWLGRHQRWGSPIFIAGESYGTTRGAALTDALQASGVAVSGLILVSCAMDLQSIVFAPRNDLPFALFLPGFACAAQFHGKLAGPHAESPAAARSAAETFVAEDYLPALFAGSRLTGDVEAPLDFCGYTHADNEEWLAASGCSSTYVSAHYTDDPCNIHASIGR